MKTWQTDPGGFFEDCLTAQHEYYRLSRKARILRTYPGMKFFGTNDRGKYIRAVATREALPDYVGVLAGGRAVLAEAKTWKGKLQHRLRQRMHQAIHLEKWGELGALAGYIVAWRWHDQIRVRWYPIASLDIQADQHGEYVVFGREEGIKVEGFDWLSAAAGEAENDGSST